MSGFDRLTQADVKDKLVQTIQVYQSSCWYCGLPWFRKPPKEEPNGMRCQYCNELNIHEEEDDLP